MSLFAVTVPAGVAPGGQFRVQVNGQVFGVTCPPNVSPGQTIQIQLPASVPTVSAVPVSATPSYPPASSAPPYPPGNAPPYPSSNPYSAPASMDPAAAGRQLLQQGLMGSQPSSAIAASGGKAIPGLSHKLILPQPPQPCPDWRQPYHMNINEEQLLDGSVKSLKFGLAWDAGCDVDGSCLLFNESQELEDVVWYRQLSSRFHDAVKHSGDDRTGEGGGDDETIKIKLRKLPERIMYVVCCVSIYSGASSFSNVRRLKVSLYHGSKKPKKGGKVLMYYDMSKVHMSGHSMLVALLVRKGAWWAVRSLGESAGSCNTAASIVQNQMALLRSVFARSPAFRPTRFNVRITVLSGTNLASRDMNGKSDPFVKMTYRKHESKSEVVRKSTNPDWVQTGRPASLYITGTDLAEMKKVKVLVYDWDRFTNPDFMGQLKIPMAALVNLGPGQHSLTEQLHPNFKKSTSPVHGSVTLAVEVSH